MWSKIFFPRSLTHEEGYRAEAITPEVPGQVASCNCQEIGQNSKTASAMELPPISTGVTHHDPSQFDFESTCYSRAGSVSQFLHSRESLDSSGRQSDAESEYLHHITRVERVFNISERRDSKLTGPARNEMESSRSTQLRRSPFTTAQHSRNHLVTRSASWTISKYSFFISSTSICASVDFVYVLHLMWCSLKGFIFHIPDWPCRLIGSWNEDIKLGYWIISSKIITFSRMIPSQHSSRITHYKKSGHSIFSIVCTSLLYLNLASARGSLFHVTLCPHLLGVQCNLSITKTYNIEVDWRKTTVVLLSLLLRWIDTGWL